jgi:hypothetical protein
MPIVGERSGRGLLGFVRDARCGGVGLLDTTALRLDAALRTRARSSDVGACAPIANAHAGDPATPNPVAARDPAEGSAGRGCVVPTRGDFFPFSLRQSARVPRGQNRESRVCTFQNLRQRSESGPSDGTDRVVAVP